MRKMLFLLLFVSTLCAAPFAAKDYSSLLGMKGFSDQALKTHFKLYEGYVKNTNSIFQQLETYRNQGEEKSIPFAELKRRLMWEYDGMRLHELYFENLGGPQEPLKADSALAKALVQEFGSLEAWKADFIATGAMRGIGWAVLTQDPLTGRLTNSWINEHDTGHLAGGNPILIMDVFEHAYMIDYGLERNKYIEAFFNNINWNKVASRFKHEVGGQRESSSRPKNL